MNDYETDKYGRYLTSYDLEPINPKMGEGRIQDALRRMRDRIANGLELKAVDSTTIGDKYTHCSWGMCSSDKEQWPNVNDHIWPVEFENSGRVAPRRLPTIKCPIDKRTSFSFEQRKKEFNGCFYSCKIFQSKSRKLSRDDVISLYNTEIEKREKYYGKKHTQDDAEPWDE